MSGAAASSVTKKLKLNGCCTWFGEKRCAETEVDQMLQGLLDMSGLPISLAPFSTRWYG